MESTKISGENTRAPRSEASHSNSANDHRRGRKRKTQHGPSSSYRGVVPQPNGKWGAQIYARNSHIWIGTFRSENEAAAAYDKASILLKPEDKQRRNLPGYLRRPYEQDFQQKLKELTVEAIRGMLKDGSYESSFDEYLMERAYPAALAITSQPTRAVGMTKYGSGSGSSSVGVFKYTKLFQKELTPSDVKRYRLAIPKKHAVRCFHHVDHMAPTEEGDDRIEAPTRGGRGNVGGGGIRPLALEFLDISTDKRWQFRYRYCASTKSYAFTEGWNRYVKENKLKKRDVVEFYRYEAQCSEGKEEAQCSEGKEEAQAFFVINVPKMTGTQAAAATTASAAANDNDVALPEAIGKPIKQQDSFGVDGRAAASDHGHPINRNPSVFHADMTPMHQDGDDAPLNKGFMLFGVRIIPST